MVFIVICFQNAFSFSSPHPAVFVAVFWIMFWCRFKILTFDRAGFSETCLSRMFVRYQRHDVDFFLWHGGMVAWCLHGLDIGARSFA